jgi:hypothetical protein
MDYVTCPRCSSRRLTTAVQCMDCWWSRDDWAAGRLQPVTDRLDYQRADGTVWRWVRTEAGGSWFQQDVPR